jgi:lysophospholipase L1-like esterase
MPKGKDVALSAAATGLALVLAEAVARLVLPPLPHVEVRPDPGAPARRRAEIAEQRSIETATGAIDGLYVYTPSGLRMRANTLVHVEQAHVSGHTVEIRTNALGYRNREIGPKERRRVLFLGDSITNAGYLEDRLTFVRLVEEMSADGEPLETINAGVGGIGIEDELAILTETGLSTDPDVVVLGFYLNDAMPSPAVWPLAPPSGLERSRLVGSALTAIARVRHWGRTDDVPEMPDLDGWRAQVRRDFPTGKGDPRTDRAAFHLEIVKNFRDWGCAWSDGAWTRMEPVLRELHRLARVHGFALGIVCFPHRMQVEAEYVADEPQRRLAAIAAGLDVPYLDLLPVLRAAHRAQGAPPLYFDHCHPTAAGNAIVAREILAFLRRTAP